MTSTTEKSLKPQLAEENMMYDSMTEVQGPPDTIKIDIGGKVKRVNIGLTVPTATGTKTATFTSPKQAQSSERPMESSALIIYPKGDRLNDQIARAMEVANKVSQKTRSI